MCSDQPELELIPTNLRRYTFESSRIRRWVEDNSSGKVLNLFAGRTQLNLDETRNDLDEDAPADYHMDCVDFVKQWKGDTFDTIILDPPYALRKAMEMYGGRYTSRFKMLADEIPRILSEGGRVISFGYHTTFLGKVRGYRLQKLCVFAHGGAQHATIAIIEESLILTMSEPDKFDGVPESKWFDPSHEDGDNMTSFMEACFPTTPETRERMRLHRVIEKYAIMLYWAMQTLETASPELLGHRRAKLWDRYTALTHIDEVDDFPVEELQFLSAESVDNLLGDTPEWP